MRLERVTVSCREEFQAQQEPVAFRWRGQEYMIRGVCDRWYEGSLAPQRVPLRYYRVETFGGEYFIIRYNELFGAWSLLVPGSAPSSPDDAGECQELG
jgi:hypothetical protein